MVLRDVIFVAPLSFLSQQSVNRIHSFPLHVASPLSWFLVFCVWHLIIFHLNCINTCLFVFSFFKTSSSLAEMFFCSFQKSLHRAINLTKSQTTNFLQYRSIMFWLNGSTFIYFFAKSQYTYWAGSNGKSCPKQNLSSSTILQQD